MAGGWDDLYRINPGYGGPRTSLLEIRDILVAVVLLTAAFFIMFRSDGTFSQDALLNGVCWFAVAFLVVVSGFMIHELSHKFVAQRYGAWAEFRMYLPGLMLALFMSLFGFLFAAPGAVHVQGRITDEQNGRISAAGPGVNLMFGLLGIVGWIYTSGNVSMIFFMFAYINVFLGFFNLLPIPPLDGSKIFRWNPALHVAMIVSAAVMLAVLFRLFF